MDKTVDRATREGSRQQRAERVEACSHPAERRARLPYGEFCRACEGVRPDGRAWARTTDEEQQWIEAHPEAIEDVAAPVRRVDASTHPRRVKAST